MTFMTMKECGLQLLLLSPRLPGSRGGVYQDLATEPEPQRPSAPECSQRPLQALPLPEAKDGIHLRVDLQADS